ncbi:MAG: carbamoyltransferase family protein [Candidatus Electronema sp. V4]|uniref:carbamoyltransferase family protein n=1 Tax=Candidatus Electronema sp. V4 TaxID=3454756 RepID=UPI0040554730
MANDTYILGLNYIGHDASASLIRNGEVLASVMEERFSRQKHDRSFPMQAIQYCLKTAGITAQELAAVCFYMDAKEHFEQRVIHHLGRYYPKSAPLFPDMLNRALKVNDAEKEIRDRLQYLGKVYFADHHKSHIATAFFLSPYEEAAIISIDGLGEISSTVIADVQGAAINVIKRINFPHSLGMLYSAVTHYLGFNAVSDAGKVMGLTSYGDRSVYLDEFRKLIRLHEDGGYELDLDYFEFPFQRDLWISEKFIQLFGPKRSKNEPLEKRHHDIAAALQAMLEEVYFHLAKYAKKATGRDYLCLSGGVTLNSVANGKLLEKEYFKDMFVPPPTGDDGASIGCALLYNYQELGNTERYPLKNGFLGPEYSDEEIEGALQRFNLSYYKSGDACQETAAMLADNKIVGWFQGRMEVGPRALGNRSILANPALDHIKDTLNARVKFREPFRPFAPSVLAEDVGEWFTYDHEAPYMLFVFDVKEEKRSRVPGITHVDGSGRLQSVDRERNPKYHRLISEFKTLTGIPMVINTSFNIKGEPIVNTPADAIRCFLGNGLDCLVLGDFVVRK